MLIEMQQYYADYLGVVPESQKGLYVDFLKKGGQKDVGENLHRISNYPVTPNFYQELDSAIRSRIGAERFVTLSSSPFELPEKHQERWGDFQGACIEALAPVFLARENMLDGIFISGNLFSKYFNAIMTDEKLAAVRGYLFNGSNGPELRHSLDGLQVTVEEGQATVGTVFEVKSTTTRSPKQLRQLALPLFENPATRDFIKHLAASAAEVSPDRVTVPNAEDIRMILVAGQKSFSTRKATDLDEKYGENTVIMNINSRNFGFFMLSLMSGETVPEVNPENYFVPISPQLASTIEYMRRGFRSTIAA
jgi:hypothetical protein